MVFDTVNLLGYTKSHYENKCLYNWCGAGGVDVGDFRGAKQSDGGRDRKKPGRRAEKLLLTGGGRCNITHTGTVDDFVRAYGKSGRFLRHCLHEFSPEATREFFNQIGIATKVDEAGCVFPLSERAGDVRDALLRQCEKLGVQFIRGRGVQEIQKVRSEYAIFAGGEIASAPKVIIATGGASYPATGSTGDGYKLAKSLRHTIIEPRAALVPLVSTEKWCAELAGISRDNITISAVIDKKKD